MSEDREVRHDIEAQATAEEPTMTPDSTASCESGDLVRIECPRFNWGAFLLPPIWGVAHGQWWGVFFLPAWVFVDNMLRGPAVLGPWTIVIGAAMGGATLGLQAVYARTANVVAARRIGERAAFEVFLRRQRAWAVAGAAVIVAMIAWIAAFIAMGGAPIG